MQKRTTTRKRTTKKRKLRKDAILSLFVIVLGVFLIIQFHSSPQRYQLVVYDESNTMNTIQYYTDFKAAKAEMNKLMEEGAYNPAILNSENEIMAIRYGIVNFKTKTCGENTSYQIVDSTQTGYTNGCYGADGAYIETDDQASQVRFRLSGVDGWVDMDEVEIRNYYDKSKVASMNYYSVVDNEIIHYGSMDMDVYEYPIVVSIGENSIGLKDNTNYYSYDSHYFYESYEMMIDDYRNNTYEHSVNTSPYFNYYQYLSHRSKSSYVSKDINWYISSYLGYTSKPSAYPANHGESQLFDEGYSFVEAQNTYGVNALMMLSLAINESGLGRSQIAIEKNNLFGHAAYDNAPNESANGYKDVASSIQTHASIFLNKGYLNPCDQAEKDSNPKPSTCLTLTGNRYAGGFFGDKQSGMNVHYASDPYWGEKAAQYYRQMDQVLGEHDKNRYIVKVLKKQNMKALSLPSLSSTALFLTPSLNYYALTIVDTIEGEEVDGNTTWYKIQSDASLNEARNQIHIDPDKYNVKNDIIYMPAAWFYE